MGFFPTNNPEKTRQEFNDLMRAESTPTMEELIKAAGLNQVEAAFLEIHQDKMLPVLQQDAQGWLTVLSPSPCLLKRTMEKLVLLDDPKVVGDKFKVVADLFSKSSRLRCETVPGGVVIGKGSGEHSSYLFELDIFAELFDQSCKIELAPKLSSGKTSEFCIHGENDSRLHVEAKCVNPSIVHKHLHGVNLDVDFRPSIDDERVLRDELKERIQEAYQKFCESDGQYAIFVDPVYPIDCYGKKSAEYLQKKRDDGWPSRPNLQYVAFRDTGGWLRVDNAIAT